MSIIQSKIIDLYQKLDQIYRIRIRIEIVATIDRTPKFGSKKSIKRRFEYDLDRNLAQGRSNPISLQLYNFALLQ